MLAYYAIRILCLKKVPFYFLNNFVKNQQILISFLAFNIVRKLDIRETCTHRIYINKTVAALPWEN